MKMYFSFFFFFPFSQHCFFLLFTVNTVNFDSHTLTQGKLAVNLFFSNFSCLLYTSSLYWSTVKASLDFFLREVFSFLFLYRTSDFYVALFEKTCIVFLFSSSIFSYDDFTSFFLTCTQSLTGEHLEFTISAFLFRRQRWVWWIIWIFAGTGSSHSGGVSRHFRLWWRWVIPFPAMGAGVEVMASRVSMVGTKFIITSHLEKIKNIYYYFLYFFFTYYFYIYFSLNKLII